jgi:hypothetical protein
MRVIFTANHIEACQTMSKPRAVRYRRLALAEQDKQKADLVYKIADEADKGGHCRMDDRRPGHAGAGENRIGFESPYSSRWTMSFRRPKAC